MTQTEAIEASRTHAKVVDTSTGATHEVVGAKHWPFVQCRKASGHVCLVIGSVLQVQR